MVDIERPPAERHTGRAPEGVTPRRAKKAETVVSNEYRDYDVDYQDDSGEWLSVMVRARKLTWKERGHIEERHTRVTPARGREPAQARTDGSGMLSGILAAMIDAPNCDPPLMLDQMHDNLFRAIVARLNVNGGAGPEVEERAGES